MKKYTILGHLFELEDNAQHFLARYIERIEEYAKSHSISAEVVDDIKYNIIEKLYTYEAPVSEKQVMHIANTLGEPAVMFDENEDGEQKTHAFRRALIIDKEKPLIRGVCYRLSKLLRISVRYVRIAFIVLALLHGTGLFLYIIGALFVPFRDKKKTTGAIGSVLFEIVRIIFWLVVIGLLLPLTIVIIFGWVLRWVLPHDVHFAFGPRIPLYLHVCMAVGIAGLLVILIGSIGALFKKRWLHTGLILAACSMVFVSGVVVIATGVRTYLSAMENRITIHQSIVTPTESGTTLSMDAVNIFEGVTMYRQFGRSVSNPLFIFHPTQGDKVTFDINADMVAPNPYRHDHMLSAAEPFAVTSTSSGMALGFSGGTLTVADAPFAFFRSTISVGVPENYHEIILRTSRNYPVHFVYSTDEHGEWRSRFCTSNRFVLDQQTHTFVCTEAADRSD